tara:strand:- start:102 stop:1367 length:1266 start_codon:yes stop_codon:yes gene_type:complete
MKLVAVLTVTALLGTACTAKAEDAQAQVETEVSVEKEAGQVASETSNQEENQKDVQEELVWPEWAQAVEMEISSDIKYGPSVRKTFTLEQAQSVIGKLRYLVENTEGTEEYPYHNIWKGNLGTGLLQLGEYELAYHYLNEVYNLPDDAPFGTEKVDDKVVVLTKAEEMPEKRLHGRLLKAMSMLGLNEDMKKVYALESYSDALSMHSWGVTSAAWAMDNIGEKEEAYKLFDLVSQPEPFGEERPYQAASNILAAAAFAYQNADFEKALSYTDRIVSEGVEPMNLAYFKGQDLESEKRMVYFTRHWESSYALAKAYNDLAQQALEGKVIDFTNLKDGTYKKSNTGYMLTPINVEVLVQDGKITSITADQPGEKDDRSAAALFTIPNRIVQAGNLEVDSVSSATISSESIKLSVAQALLEAMK